VSSGSILLTGGSGLLGGELRGLIPGLVTPTRAELDVTRPDTIEAALEKYRPEVVVHAAAYTDVARAERERERCWRTNVGGTRNLVRVVSRLDVCLVHISTDYVFAGARGGYAEDDPPGPPRNYYALSKLVAEEIARAVDRHLVIRTSFRPRSWPYPIAFTDVYTSQDYVDVIAPEVALAIRHAGELAASTLHIGTDRKSVYELALRRSPGVLPGSKRDAGVDLPDDVSLDTSRWSSLKKLWQST
jgi:dTDP-4-dehydrorhamnose reductase